jgi:hypothetical protein
MPLQVPIEIEIEICGYTKLLHEAQQATCLFLCLQRKMDHMHFLLRLCIKLACMTSTITNDFCSKKFCHFFIQKNWEKITFDWMVLFLSNRGWPLTSVVFYGKFLLSTKTFEKNLENFVFLVLNGFFKQNIFFVILHYKTRKIFPDIYMPSLCS